MLSTTINSIESSTINLFADWLIQLTNLLKEQHKHIFSFLEVILLIIKHNYCTCFSSQMLNRIQTTTGIITIGFVMLTLIYHQTSINSKKLSHSYNYNDLFEYSKELNELR